MSEYIKKTGRKGYTTFQYNGKYLYSIYDPVNEAKKFISGFKKINPFVITCCGVDYVNAELLSNQDIKLIISFEPIAFDRIINDSKIIRVKNINEIEKIFLNKNIHASEVSLLLWQPLIETNNDIYLNPLKKLKDILYKASFSANTAKTYGYLESMNLLTNIFTLDKIEIIKKNELFTDSLAVIISSGPSLIDSIDFINKIKDTVYLFALPSSLPFLYHKGIYPDYVIAVDPGYATLYHLSKYKHNIKLIAPLSIYPVILRLKNIKPIFFNYCNHIENIFYNDTAVINSPAEGSVFINLIRILPQIGFKEAIVFGQDFGFKEYRSHIQGGIFEYEFIKKSDYFTTLDFFIKKLESRGNEIFINIAGKKIKSTDALKLYFDHFLKIKFDITLLLPDNCLNPISDEIKKVDVNYILKKNYIKNQKMQKLETVLLSNLGERKNKIKNLLLNLINKNDEAEILIESFIDKNNIRHKEKLTKILGANN